jgi:hypothetical protein
MASACCHRGSRKEMPLRSGPFTALAGLQGWWPSALPSSAQSASRPGPPPGGYRRSPGRRASTRPAGPARTPPGRRPAAGAPAPAPGRRATGPWLMPWHLGSGQGQPCPRNRKQGRGVRPGGQVTMSGLDEGMGNRDSRASFLDGPARRGQPAASSLRECSRVLARGVLAAPGDGAQPAAGFSAGEHRDSRQLLRRHQHPAAL